MSLVTCDTDNDGDRNVLPCQGNADRKHKLWDLLSAGKYIDV